MVEIQIIYKQKFQMKPRKVYLLFKKKQPLVIVYYLLFSEEFITKKQLDDTRWNDTVIADIKEIFWKASWKQSLACYNYCLSNCHRGRKLWRPQWNSDYYRQIKVLTTKSQNDLSCVALDLTCESIYCPQFFFIWFFSVTTPQWLLFWSR